MAVAVFSLLPFVYLISAGVSFEAVRRLFSYPETISVITRTITLSLAVTGASVVIGVAAAFVVVRTDVPLRRTLTVLLTMPLSVPLFVSSYAAYSANLMFAPARDIVTSFAGAVAIMTLVLYPYVFLACVVALRNIDASQEEIARSLRAHPLVAFWRVTFPQLRPAIAVSGLIIALHVVSEYGAMVQTRQKTLTTSIMSEMINYGNYESARSLSLLLTIIVLVLIVGARFVSGRAAPLSVSLQSARTVRRERLGRARFVVLGAALLLPALGLLPTVFMTLRGLTSPHRDLIISWTHVASAATVTASYGLWAALVTTLAALPVSWWLSRRPTMLAQLTERSVWLAHTIPNAVLALSLVYISIRLVPAMYKTAPVLVAAYVILFLPLAVSNQLVGLQAAMPKFGEMASSLGSSAFDRFRRVTLPLAFPGIATGALLVGLDAAKELTTTLMLLPFNTQSLATGLWATTEGETLDFTAAAPYALMLLVLGAIPVFLIVRSTLRHVR